MRSLARSGTRILLGGVLVATAILKLHSPAAGHFDRGWVIAAAAVELVLACLLVCQTTRCAALAGIALLSLVFLLLGRSALPGGARCGCFGAASGLERWSGAIAALTGLTAIVGLALHAGRDRGSSTKGS